MRKVWWYAGVLVSQPCGSRLLFGASRIMIFWTFAYQEVIWFHCCSSVCLLPIFLESRSLVFSHFFFLCKQRAHNGEKVMELAYEGKFFFPQFWGKRNQSGLNWDFWCCFKNFVIIFCLESTRINAFMAYYFSA